MSKKGKELKVSYIKQIQEQYNKKPMEGDLSIEIHLYFGNLRTHDWDNFHKISMDAMTGIVWVDDVQVQRAVVEKHYCKENPRIEIEINKYK
jgi:Holliday junction resolvase RusA-like endonuclease